MSVGKAAMNRVAHDRIQWMAVLVVSCLVAVFLFESQSAASYPTYFLALAMLATAAKWSDVFRLLIVRCIAFLLLWLLMSTAWSTPVDPRAALSTLTRASLLFLFVIAVGECQLRGQMQHWMGRALALSGTVAMSGALIHFIITDPVDGRLNGLGQLDTHIIAALVFGVVMLFGLRLLMTETDWIWRAIATVCIGLAIACIALSDSRTAWVAVTAGAMTYVGAFLIRDVRQLMLSMTVMVFLAATAFLVLIANDAVREMVLPRGDSFRLAIWSHFSEQIMLHPLIGSGVTTEDRIEIGGIIFHHPHNVYLSLLFQGGLLALVGYLSVLLMCLHVVGQCYEHPDAKLVLSMLTLSSLAFLLDGHAVIDKVGEMWFLLWLPVGICVGLYWGRANRP